MQILRFESDDHAVYTGCDPDDGTAAVIEGDVFSDFRVTRDRKKVVRFLPPVQPAAVFCIGLNYRSHAAETKMDIPQYPVVFMKNPGAAVGHLDPVRIPACCTHGPEVDYEAELAVVIKNPVRNAGAGDALDHVLGYTCANDISARRWQMHAGGRQWVRGKSFDTFCPMGPWIVTPDDLPDPDHLDIQCVLNGRTMQSSTTGDMIFSVGRIISFLSESTTLLPGTVILTGTPGGVGFTRTPPLYLKAGDVLETRIQGIGRLKNEVTQE